MPSDIEEPQQGSRFSRFCTGFKRTAKVLAYCALATTIIAIPLGAAVGEAIEKWGSEERVSQFSEVRKRLNAAAKLVGYTAVATVVIGVPTAIAATVGFVATGPFGAVLAGGGFLAKMTEICADSPGASRMGELYDFISGKSSSLAAADLPNNTKNDFDNRTTQNTTPPLNLSSSAPAAPAVTSPKTAVSSPPDAPIDIPAPPHSIQNFS